MFITAIKAQAAAQLAAFEQLEKEEIMQQDRDAKKSAAALDQDKQELDAVTKRAKELKLDAARKSAEAAAIVANAHILSPSQISGSDLFDVGARRITSDGLQRRRQTPRIQMTCLAAPADRLTAPLFSPTGNRSAPSTGLNGRPKKR